MAKDPENTYDSLLQAYPDAVRDFGAETNFQIELNLKYAGYINRQTSEVAKLAYVEETLIPSHFDYSQVPGLRNEARQKLAKASPRNLGQALRISGVSPADISILMIALSRGNKTSDAISSCDSSDCES
jgi:tRNA uridine 5-carboxymethylaminomethyl modification enzyme